MSEQSNNQGGGGTRSTTTNNNTRAAGNNRSGPGKGSGKGKNTGKGRKPSNSVAAVPKPKFTGSCKKDLEGVVIIHNPNKQVMTKQFIEFGGY